MSGADGVRLTNAERAEGVRIGGPGMALLFHEGTVERILADRLAALTQDRDEQRTRAEKLLAAFKREHTWRRETEAERDEARAVVEAVRALTDGLQCTCFHAGTYRCVYCRLRALLPEPETSEGADGPCCDSHVAGPTRPNGMSWCCDTNDCGPCCENCPTCPTLARQREGATP